MGVSIYNTPERDQILTQSLIHKGQYNPEIAYQYGDVVNDGLWTMSANKDTQDRPAPQPNGGPFWGNEIPAFAENQISSVVYSGNIFGMQVGGWIKEIRVWVPELTSNTNYRILIFRNYGSPNQVITSIEEPVLSLNDWTTLAVGNTIVGAGEQIAVVLDSLNSGGDTIVTGGWNYAGTSSSAPLTQTWNKSSANNVLRISITDLDSSNRQTELLGFVPGTTVQFVNTLVPSNQQTFLIQGQPQLVGSHVEYAVALIDSVGNLPIGEATTMTAAIPIADTTKYVVDAGHYSVNPSWANVTGLLQFDGVDQPGNEDNGFGVDIRFQPAYVSPDWNYISGI